MSESEVIAIATKFLYPKGLPHPGCAANAARFISELGRWIVHFPHLGHMTTKRMKRLHEQGLPIPPAPGVRDPNQIMVSIDPTTGRATKRL